MGNFIKATATLELAAWLPPEDRPLSWDVLKGGPFGKSLSSSKGNSLLPATCFNTVQNYFAEYHLEYFRQRRFNHFPSRLHALILFATRTDAMAFRSRHPELVQGKQLVGAKTLGSYLCSFHDGNWLDYLRLPHSLGLDTLDEVADHYWSGRTVEEVGPKFMGTPWREPPVIEALFQGDLETALNPGHRSRLPGFA